MKIKVKYIAWVLGFLGLYGLHAQTLTLNTAVSKTLAHHPDVKTFMLRIQQAKQGYKAAYADYLPEISLSATYAPTQTYTLRSNDKLRTVNEKAWNVGVTLRQKVWDFTKTASLVKAAKVDEDISKLSMQEAKALLAYKVKSLYELLVVQKEAISVRKKDLKAKKAFYAQSQALVKQGLKTRADASRFLASVYGAKDNLAIAQAAFEKAKMSLSLYMGVTLKKSITLQSNALKKHFHLKKNVEREVLNNNYKIKISRRSAKKNKLLHRASRAARFGSIDLVATHSRISALSDYNSNYVGVSYTVPLYSGGRLSAQEQEAKIGYEIAREQTMSAKLSLKEELRSLLIDIKRYNKTIQAKNSQLVSAKSTRRVMQARYKEGLVTYIELLDSTTGVLNAKLGLLEAYYSRSLAIDRIEYLKGKTE